MTTICPACRWENDTDSGPCAGCGRDLTGGSGAAPPPAWSDPSPAWPEAPPAWPDPAPVGPPPAAVPEPRARVEQPVVPAVAPAPEPAPSVVHTVAERVPIRPQTRPQPRTVEPAREAPRPVDPQRAPRPAESVLRQPAPVRDIPVVVAPAAAAVRFRDNEARLDPGGPAFPAPERVPLGPGTRLCPSCGTSVEVTRRFCRCGARLPGAAPRDGAPSTTAEGWSKASFKRAQRVANGGRRVGYDVPLSARVLLVRAVAVLLLVLVLGSQAPPWGPDVRHWVQTRVEQALPGH